jgi:hypothetical protein
MPRDRLTLQPGSTLSRYATLKDTELVISETMMSAS